MIHKQSLDSSMDELMINVNSLVTAIEQAVLQTPTGLARNLLCDARIMIDTLADKTISLNNTLFTLRANYEATEKILKGENL